MVQHDTVVPVSSKEGQITWHRLPAGCRSYLNVPATHYSARNWIDPKKIDIDRWQPGRQRGNKAESSGRFLAFSRGARTCLGKKFALVELTSFFATVLKDYRVELGVGLDRKQVERDLFTKCAERLTLAPPQ
jgi:cytochrome P450